MPPPDGPAPLRQVLALGLLQGPAELLPISSSAHISLIPWLCGWSCAARTPRERKDLEVALHAGAGLALVLATRRELRVCVSESRRDDLLLLAAALAPAALAGVAFQCPIERRLGGPRASAGGLLAGAGAMALADRRTPAQGTRTRAQADWRDGLALGLAQAAALAPGVSRSGATLATARWRGFSRADSHRLSWEVGLPLIVGPALLRARPTFAHGAVARPLAGAGAAFVSTWAAARARGRVAEQPLLPYAAYRALLAGIVAVRLRRAQ